MNSKKINVETDSNNIDMLGYGMSLEIIYGDLFTEENASLGHCISRDFAMSKGIAKEMKERFMRDLRHISGQYIVGNVAVVHLPDNRFIYNLITKERYWEKPTYDSLRTALVAMRKHIVAHGVREVAMPLIGCGLDRLEWAHVSDLIEDVFCEIKISFRIYCLSSNNYVQ